MATNYQISGLSTLNLKEKLTLCNTWQKSGLSRSEFIRRNNLPKSFHYWCNKLLPQKHPSVLLKTKDNVKADCSIE